MSADRATAATDDKRCFWSRRLVCLDIASCLTSALSANNNPGAVDSRSRQHRGHRFQTWEGKHCAIRQREGWVEGGGGESGDGEGDVGGGGGGERLKSTIGFLRPISHDGYIRGTGWGGRVCPQYAC